MRASMHLHITYINYRYWYTGFPDNSVTPELLFRALRCFMIEMLFSNANRHETWLRIRIFNDLHFQDRKFRGIEILCSTYRGILRIEKPITTLWFPYFTCNNEFNLPYHGFCLLFIPFSALCCVLFDRAYPHLSRSKFVATIAQSSDTTSFME